MTVRFKSRSEYQKSYGVSRSRSASPQRCAPWAGLRSAQMGIGREPCLQRRRRPGPGGLAQSCTSPLRPSDPQHSPAEPAAHRKMPPAAAAAAAAAASRSRSAHRREPSLDPEPPTPPERRAEPESPAEPRPAAAEPGAAGQSMRPRPSRPDSQPQPSRPVTSAPGGQQQPPASEVERALRWRAGLRSGGQRSEYHRQFSWKKPATTASPVLTADQVVFSSNRSVPPFKKNPVPMETEYRRSFQGLVPAAGPRLRKHLDHQRAPLFHTHTTNRKRRELLQKKLRPGRDAPTPQRDDATPPPPPPPPQVQRGHRMLTEYQSSFRSPLHRIPEEGAATDGDAPQARALRQQALAYRRRAWGTNFSRDHLSQLRSEHNALWEPTDTADSATGPPTPRLTFDLCQDPDSRSTSCVEALDLVSRSSRRSSVVDNTNKNTQTKAQTPPAPPAERRTAWEEEEEEGEGEENTDGEEGRLPTPRLKFRPVQRTHHDLTTPATGGAILVGKGKSSDDKQQRCGSAVSVAAGPDAAADLQMRQKEAWPESNRPHTPSPGPSPDHKPASKPIRTKQTPPPPVAPPPPVLHGIQGTLRHPDFQHNGELGLRFRELQCSAGGCGSDEDDRLSVMSWRSAASCSMASSVLERAQKRRENFWGKR